MLLQGFYSVRSERQLVERMESDLVFCWFVGLGMEDPVWDASTFSKNRDRLLEGEVAQRSWPSCWRAGGAPAPVERALLGRRHADPGLGQPESFRRKDGEDEPPGPGRNGERDFRGEKRSNATHASTTDPDARLYRKGTASLRNSATSATR